MFHRCIETDLEQMPISPTLSTTPVAQTTTFLNGRGHRSTPLCVTESFIPSESCTHESHCARNPDTAEAEDKAPGWAGRSLTFGTWVQLSYRIILLLLYYTTYFVWFISSSHGWPRLGSSLSDNQWVGSGQAYSCPWPIVVSNSDHSRAAHSIQGASLSRLK